MAQWHHQPRCTRCGEPDHWHPTCCRACPHGPHAPHCHTRQPTDPTTHHTGPDPDCPHCHRRAVVPYLCHGCGNTWPISGHYTWDPRRHHHVHQAADTGQARGLVEHCRTCSPGTAPAPLTAEALGQ